MRLFKSRKLLKLAGCLESSEKVLESFIRAKAGHCLEFMLPLKLCKLDPRCSIPEVHITGMPSTPELSFDVLKV